MVIGTVVGNVWSSRRLKEVPAGALLEVEIEATSERIVVFDPLGTGVGERVLVSRGQAAADWFESAPAPIDALLIGSVDARADADGTPVSGVSDNDKRVED